MIARGDSPTAHRGHVTFPTYRVILDMGLGRQAKHFEGKQPTSLFLLSSEMKNERSPGNRRYPMSMQKEKTKIPISKDRIKRRFVLSKEMKGFRIPDPVRGHDHDPCHRGHHRGHDLGLLPCGPCSSASEHRQREECRGASCRGECSNGLWNHGC